MALKKGMTLYCKNYETVTLVDFDEESVVVQYRGKFYKRSRHCIGRTLFAHKSMLSPEDSWGIGKGGLYYGEEDLSLNYAERDEAHDYDDLEPSDFEDSLYDFLEYDDSEDPPIQPWEEIRPDRDVSSFQNIGGIEDHDLMNNPSFSLIYSFLQTVFSFITERDEGRQKVQTKKYQKYVFRSLDDFSMGNEPDPFSFSVILRNSLEMKWIRFSTAENSLDISGGGMPDSTGAAECLPVKWYYTVWNDGETEIHGDMDFEETVQNISPEVGLIVHEPESYIIKE